MPDPQILLNLTPAGRAVKGLNLAYRGGKAIKKLSSAKKKASAIPQKKSTSAKRETDIEKKLREAFEGPDKRTKYQKEVANARFRRIIN